VSTYVHAPDPARYGRTRCGKRAPHLNAYGQEVPGVRVSECSDAVTCLTCQRVVLGSAARRRIYSHRYGS
jgi:hypothetical protein